MSVEEESDDVDDDDDDEDAAAVEMEEEEEENDVRMAWLNKRVRSFAGVMRASLSRVGCVTSEDDLRAECAALIDRLRRFVAEGGDDDDDDE